MKLVEIIAAVILVSVASASFAGVFVPILRISNETAAIKQEFNTNRFITESFCALTAMRYDFEKWRSTVHALTGCDVAVTKTQSMANASVYRAQWMYKEKPLYVDAVFNF
jgi:hypothetical protein